jgi:hypothetical protein
VNKVFGKVLVKETGAGIPNLLVALFDVDPQAAAQSTAYMDPSCLPAAGVRRIGSVITTENGAFELTFDPSSFTTHDAESRPGLLLRVYAPEDSQDLDLPTSLPPSGRLLLFSNVQRHDAGQIEAYILRVPRSMLEKFDIPLPDVPGGLDTKLLASRLVNAQKARKELEDLVREGLAPLRKARFERHREIVTASKMFVSKLGAAPMMVRMQPTFVGPGNDLASAQRAAMARGLVALNGLVQSRPILYEVTREDLAILETPIVYPLLELYELTHEEICRLLGRRLGGVALERILDLVEARKEEAEARSRIDHITTTDEEGEIAQPDSDGEQPLEDQTNIEIIAAGVRGQLTDLAAPAAAPAASIEELSARLTGFTLPPGPADVTSLHDFHQLQIAFEHVWTEAFDEDLKERLQELYKETVELHDEFGLQLDTLTEVPEIRDMLVFLATIDGQSEALKEECPLLPLYTLDEVRECWWLLSDLQRARLEENVHERQMIAWNCDWEGQRDLCMAKDDRLMAEQRAIASQPGGRAGRVTRLLAETHQRLTEPYAFHYFAPNSVNFGILVTYRQKWEPLTYQVGDLVATIPLAPGEVRRFSSKTVIKRTRAQKELEKALLSRSGESSLTQRAEAEITSRASTTTNFKNTAQGTFNIGIGSVTGTTEFVLNQVQQSASVKKSFREAVIKAAHEYKQERALEVETTQETTVETTTSGEISNPNNEMTVTYLLYELERQYRISERIHRVMPVILVAQDVPGPHKITESWLLAHEWILRRVLLDDDLELALDYLKEGFTGDELSLEIKRANWQVQNDLVGKLETSLSEHLTARDALRAALVDRTRARELAKAAEDSVAKDIVEGILTSGFSLVTDSGVDEAARIEANRKAIEMSLGYAEQTVKEMQEKLEVALEALQKATDDMTEALQRQSTKRTTIDQLRVHIKENILYYMQAIWDHEPPDQRFFRLYYQEVDLPEAPTTICVLRRATPEELALGIETIVRHGDYYVIEGCEAPALPDLDHPNTKKLVEIADLDHPLGYKGNYIIFPLKACVYLTQFMMKQFIDSYFGVRDPDEAANYSTEELLTYLEAIWDDPQITLSEEEREAVLNLVLSRIREPRRDSDIVVVPSGQIYIEALLGGHPLLEPFKRIHRAYDVGKARAELRQSELENLRRAARLLQEEPDLDDPDIDKHVLIEGSSAVVVEPD